MALLALKTLSMWKSPVFSCHYQDSALMFFKSISRDVGSSFLVVIVCGEDVGSSFLVVMVRDGFVFKNAVFFLTAIAVVSCYRNLLTCCIPVAMSSVVSMIYTKTDIVDYLRAPFDRTLSYILHISTIFYLWPFFFLT